MQTHTFYRLIMLDSFEKAIAEEKQKLMDELIDQATDPVIQMRRFRMLSQLSAYESQIIAKIQSMDTDDIGDFFSYDYIAHINTVTMRNG